MVVSNERAVLMTCQTLVMSSTEVVASSISAATGRDNRSTRPRLRLGREEEIRASSREMLAVPLPDVEVGSATPNSRRTACRPAMISSAMRGTRVAARGAQDTSRDEEYRTQDAGFERMLGGKSEATVT